MRRPEALLALSLAAGALLVAPRAARELHAQQPPASALERVIHGFGYRVLPGSASEGRGPGVDEVDRATTPGTSAAPGAQSVPRLRELEVDELGPYWLTERVWRGAASRLAGWPAGAEPGTGVLEASPHDPTVIYHAGRTLHRTSDGGSSWAALDPPSVAPDARVVALEESPLEPGLLWAGLADGTVRVSRDGGRSWSEATPSPAGPDVPGASVVRALEPSPHDPARAYLALGGAPDDESVLLLRTDDQGATWTWLTPLPEAGLEPSIRGEARTIREDPELAGLVFAGTDEGIFASFDGGESWDGLQLDLPRAPVDDLRILGRDLLVDVGEHGVWVLRDLSPLRQVLRGLAAGEPYLFEPAPAYHVDPDAPGGLVDGADNPMAGAVFDYLLPSIVGRVRLEVIDGDGRVLQAFGSDRAPAPLRGPAADEPPARPGRGIRPEGTRSGVHRVVWDLRPMGAEGVAGPPLRPGSYRLRMSVDGMQRERPFEVLPDPRTGRPSG